VRHTERKHKKRRKRRRKKKKIGRKQLCEHIFGSSPVNS
jgi:hypothetical protein